MRVSRPGASLGLGGLNVSGPRLRFGGGSRRSSSSGSIVGTVCKLVAITVLFEVILAAWMVQYVLVLPIAAGVRAARHEQPVIPASLSRPWGLRSRPSTPPR